MSEQLFNSHGFLQLNLGKMRVLVPQHEVQSLESTLDISVEKNDMNSIGNIINNGVTHNVFNFDDKLNVIQSMSDSRRICVCLQNDDVAYGVTCDAVNNIDLQEVKLVELPECMKNKYCPVLYLGIYKNRVINVVNTSTLNNVISQTDNLN